MIYLLIFYWLFCCGYVAERVNPNSKEDWQWHTLVVAYILSVVLAPIMIGIKLGNKHGKL